MTSEIKGPLHAEATPSLLERLLCDGEFERRAFECLARQDLDGCRRAFAAMLEALLDDLEPPRARDRIGLLLLDVLHKVNLRLRPAAERDPDYQRRRLELIERFEGQDGAGLRPAFLGALERLLAPSTDAAAVHPIVARARAHIASNYHGRLYLSSVAAALNVSPNYLSRLFRRETGTTLTAFIQRVRLEEAVRLLGDGGRRISEIAYLVGYQNYRDFYRNFVKYEKTSPRRMQRRLSKGSPALPVA
jgi:AraC-like DNA-binding protein